MSSLHPVSPVISPDYLLAYFLKSLRLAFRLFLAD
jgi:hypothetical protein